MPPTVKKSRKRATQSLEQLWARKRNFNKRRVFASRATLTNLLADPTITSGEKLYMRKAISYFNGIIAAWEATNPISKKQYIERITK